MGALYERRKVNGVTRTTNKKSGKVSWSTSRPAGNGKRTSRSVSTGGKVRVRTSRTKT